MIVYILKDGLGNQLFEYSYACALKEKSKDCSIAFCTFLFSLKNFSLSGTRKCSLQHFNLPNNVRILHGFTNFWYFMLFMIRMFFVYRGDFVSWFIKGKRISRKSSFASDCKHGLYISESTFCIPDFIPSKKKVKFIFGNYESDAALPSDRNTLFNNLKIVTPASLQNLEMLQYITSCESVCVHIRRGDYLNKGNESLQICDYDYYKKAVFIIKETLISPTFFLFSNTHEDLEWIRKHYDLGIDMPVYVDLSNPDYEELRLMATCKHFVISNSTFSWWASQLSTYTNKIIIAPKIWSSKDPESIGMLRQEFYTC